MGVRMPETCWAVNKRQDNKLEKFLHLVGWFIWIVHWNSSLPIMLPKWRQLLEENDYVSLQNTLLYFQFSFAELIKHNYLQLASVLSITIINVFLDVTPWSLIDMPPPSSGQTRIKKKAACSSQKLICIYRATRHHIPGDRHLHGHCRKNLQSRACNHSFTSSFQ